MLDVHRPVPRALGRHQEVGLADPAAGRIRWQPAAHDDRCGRGHRGRRRRLPLGPVLPGHHAGARVQRQQPGDDLRLEPPARLEPALQHPRHR